MNFFCQLIVSITVCVAMSSCNPIAGEWKQQNVQIQNDHNNWQLSFRLPAGNSKNVLASPGRQTWVQFLNPHNENQMMLATLHDGTLFFVENDASKLVLRENNAPFGVIDESDSRLFLTATPGLLRYPTLQHLASKKFVSVTEHRVALTDQVNAARLSVLRAWSHLDWFSIELIYTYLFIYFVIIIFCDFVL